MIYVIFQRDGDPSHYCTIGELLDQKFPDKCIGERSGLVIAPRSPALTPMNFFSSGSFSSRRKCFLSNHAQHA